MESKQVAFYSEDIEIAVLSMLINLNGKEYILMRDSIFNTIQEKDFYFKKHQIIFSSCEHLYKTGVDFDTIILTEYLRSYKYFGNEDEPGALTWEYYVDLISFFTGSALTNFESLKHYLNRLIDLHKLRKIYKYLYSILNESMLEPLVTSKEILSGLEDRIYEMIKDEKFEDVKELKIDEAINNIYQERKGISSGYITLNEMLGKLRSGNLIVIAGRTSQGKTAFALNIMRNIARDLKKNTALFSIEMSKEENEWRLIAMEAKVDLLNIIDNRLSDTEKNKIENVRDVFKNKYAKLIIEDTFYRLSDISYRIKKYVREHNIELVVVDYLQLCSNEKEAFKNRDIEIGSVTRRLKQLAKELSIPIIGLSQLNRKVEDRKDKEPRLSDLRESGSIEQDSDVVLFVYRPDVYENPRTSQIIIAKARNAKIGYIDYEFEPDFQTFTEL